MSQDSYVQRELRFVLEIALEKPEGTIFLLPVRLDDCERPRRLRTIQGVDYFPPDLREWAYARPRQSLELRAHSLGIETARSEPIAEKLSQIEAQKEGAPTLEAPSTEVHFDLREPTAAFQDLGSPQ